MDDFHARALNSLRARHESLIRDQAERIQQHIGYVIKRLDAGRSDSVGMYAEDIEASARRIVARVTALEAVADAVGILETRAEDSAPAGGK